MTTRNGPFGPLLGFISGFFNAGWIKNDTLSKKLCDAHYKKKSYFG